MMHYHTHTCRTEKRFGIGDKMTKNWRMWESYCNCGFRTEAYGRVRAECKIMGHVETMSILESLKRE